MIEYKELREFLPQVRYQDGSNVTLVSIENAIRDSAEGKGIPVAFKMDRVVSKGLFRSEYEDCLVVYHPQYGDNYCKFCIRINRQGNYAFVSVEDFGRSPLLINESVKNGAVTGAIAGATRTAGMFGAIITTAIANSLRGNKSDLQNEKNYYQCMYDVFTEVFS